MLIYATGYHLIGVLLLTLPHHRFRRRHENYAGKPSQWHSISELAELLHISPTHFSNLWGCELRSNTDGIEIEYVKHKLLPANMRIRNCQQLVDGGTTAFPRLKTYTAGLLQNFVVCTRGSWEHYTVESYLLFDPSLPMYWISVSSSPGGNSAE